eukprot:UN25792
MMNVAASSLGQFAIILFIIVFAFAFLGWVMFSNHMHQFRSLQYSILNTLQYLITEPDWEVIKTGDPVAGHTFVFSWNLLASLILLNVFVAITLNAFESSKTKQKSPSGYLMSILKETWIDFWEAINWSDTRKPGDEKKDEDKIKDQMKVMLTTPEIWSRLYRSGAPKDVVTEAITKLYGDCVDDDLVDEIFELIDGNKNHIISEEEFRDMLEYVDKNIRSRLFLYLRNNRRSMMDELDKKVSRHMDIIGDKIDQLLDREDPGSPGGQSPMNKEQKWKKRVQEIT